jgi:uncharacterized protein (TIGR00296 family)
MWNKIVRRRSNSGNLGVEEASLNRHGIENPTVTEQVCPASVHDLSSDRAGSESGSIVASQQLCGSKADERSALSKSPSRAGQVNEAKREELDDLSVGSAEGKELGRTTRMASVTGSRLVASPIMCAFAFSVLERELQNRSRRPCTSDPFVDALPPDSNAYGLFITWKIHTAKWYPGAPIDPAWQLRGCIGTLTPTGLHDALRSYAITAALHDRRFAPVSLDELPRLQCGVSLLSDFTERDSVWDWTPGVDGLIIEIEPQRRGSPCKLPGRPRASRYSATYLPEVPLEFKWSKLETISSLIRKAGYMGEIPSQESDSWWDECVSLTTYRSSKAELRHDEYRAMLVQNLN